MDLADDDIGLFGGQLGDREVAARTWRAVPARKDVWFSSSVRAWVELGGVVPVTGAQRVKAWSLPVTSQGGVGTG